MNTTYKTHVLGLLENLVHDCLNDETITPEELHDTIVNLLNENCKYYRDNLEKCERFLKLIK